MEKAIAEYEKKPIVCIAGYIVIGLLLRMRS